MEEAARVRKMFGLSGRLASLLILRCMFLMVESG